MDPHRPFFIDVVTLQGKEPELFVKLARMVGKPNPLNEVFDSRMKELKIDKNDYHSVATLYVQVFNPSKISNVEPMLMKYKVRFGARVSIINSCRHEQLVSSSTSREEKKPFLKSFRPNGTRAIHMRRARSIPLQARIHQPLLRKLMLMKTNITPC